ncbi:Rho GTPase activation protein [Fistulina hepatica ATCC 64428]|uniref:Rho GTPase activation protein n=1 Tax=Fistulina hepatica ATCC 64428 TaxID=1128425 RepID=A0A0D7ALV7_9AGAR|nr:Rho GTPase activation protein [Fistulina hepatica ATCC 64428]
MLYQTVHIHRLYHTDIRHAHPSLFQRKNCIGLYSPSGHRWNTLHADEPVYLDMLSAEVCNTWIAVLRSYANAEIFGRMLFPKEEGGSYRMYRQIELTVHQARELQTGQPTKGGAEPDNGEIDSVDIDVLGEIRLNGLLYARTTLQSGKKGSPEWHETFKLTDLTPFESLEIAIVREKRNSKPPPVGTTRVALCNFPRGNEIDGWFPVLLSGPVAGDVHVGDLRLKIRVDEEIVLPFAEYNDLLVTLTSRNFLDWTTDFESKLKLPSKPMMTQLMAVAVARETLIDDVVALAERETLFRGNNSLTRVVEECMKWYGRSFLEASLGQVIRRICTEKVVIEVDPALSGKGQREQDRNLDLLMVWCSDVWNQIYAARNKCPAEIRNLFSTIRSLVEQHQVGAPDQHRELPWQSVTAFCFLRFMVPAILNPQLFGLWPGMQTPPVRRSLTLIAKVIQSLANLNPDVHKEQHMLRTKEFIRQSIPSMYDYIRTVSTPADITASAEPQNIGVLLQLQSRAATMPMLEREAIPILPDLLDVPRQLAFISSSVMRSVHHQRVSVEDPQIDEICRRCSEVEQNAMQRVQQLAACISPESLSDYHTPHIVRSSMGMEDQEHKENVRVGPVNPVLRKVRKTKRPSSTPSSDSDSSRRKRVFSVDVSAAMPRPTASREDIHRASLGHLKSVSSDSADINSPSRITLSSNGLGTSPGSANQASNAFSGVDGSDDGMRKVTSLFRGFLRSR